MRARLLRAETQASALRLSFAERASGGGRGEKASSPAIYEWRAAALRPRLRKTPKNVLRSACIRARASGAADPAPEKIECKGERKRRETVVGRGPPRRTFQKREFAGGTPRYLAFISDSRGYFGLRTRRRFPLRGSVLAGNL